MVNKLKWPEYLMLTCIALTGLWIAIEMFMAIKTFPNNIGPFYFDWWHNYSIRVPWGGPNPRWGNLYIQLIISLTVEVFGLIGIFIYMKNKTLGWYSLFIISLYNIYFVVELILNESNLIESTPTYLLEYLYQSTFDMIYSSSNFISILLVITSFTSIFCLIILFLNPIREKFKVKRKGILISLFITIAIIITHYGYSFLLY